MAASSFQAKSPGYLTTPREYFRKLYRLTRTTARSEMVLSSLNAHQHPPSKGLRRHDKCRLFCFFQSRSQPNFAFGIAPANPYHSSIRPIPPSTTHSRSVSAHSSLQSLWPFLGCTHLPLGRITYTPRS